MTRFVSDLQMNYPATIATIVRTGDKLAVDARIEQNQRCMFCKVDTCIYAVIFNMLTICKNEFQAQIENKAKELTSSEATSFSHFVSTQTANQDLSPLDRYQSLVQEFHNSKTNFYCYSCSKIIRFVNKHPE